MLSVGWFQDTWAPGANFRYICFWGDHLKPGRQTLSSKTLATSTKPLSIFPWWNDPRCFMIPHATTNGNSPADLPIWCPIVVEGLVGILCGARVPPLPSPQPNMSIEKTTHSNHDLSMPRLAYHPACHSVHEARKPISPQVEICWALLSMPLSACKTKLWPVRMIQSLEDYLQQPSPPTPQQTSGNEQVCLCN